MSNKPDKPSQDSCVEENEKQEKATWDNTAVDIFIKVCVGETLAKNRAGSHFTKVGWKNVVKKFNGLAKRNYKYKQLKNKWTALRKDWHQWASLVGKETGLGWDPVKQTINASNEWWDKKMKENPDVGKFRTRGLRNVDQLNILFKDNAVTGEGAWAPSQGFGVDVDNAPGLEEENDNIMLEDDSEYAETYNPEIENIGEREQNRIPSHIEALTQEKGNSKKIDGKKPGIGVMVSKQLQLGAIANRSSASKNQDRPGCSIEEVMKIVEEIPEIVEDDELFMKAADILTDRRNREMFIALKHSNRQVMWLKNKKI